MKDVRLRARLPLAVFCAALDQQPVLICARGARHPVPVFHCPNLV